MQLKGVVAALLLGLIEMAPARGALADGELSMRGVYYKERSTRVIQPMLDARLATGDSGTLTGHTLVDAITSASAASGAVGQSFTERRYEFGLGYLHELGRFRLGASGRLSTESDYSSAFVNVRGEVDFAQRNTTLGLSVTRGDDEIDNSGSQGGLSEIIRGSLNTKLVSVSISQLLSPVAIASVSYDVARLTGFLENPYRTVVAGGVIEPERVPDERTRHALGATLRYFSAASAMTWIAGYRFYLDDWGILGNTPELRVVVGSIENLALHVRYRYHRQRRATFYEDIYDSNDPSVEPYLTSDAKLSRLRTHTAGMKLSAALARFGVEGKWSRARIEGGFDYLRQNTSFGNALIAQMALTVPVEY